MPSPHPRFAPLPVALRYFVYCLLAGLGSALHAAAPFTDFIRVDQFGYRPAAAKTAVVVDPHIGYDSALSFSPSTGTDQYQVRRQDNDAVMLTGTLTAWNAGTTDASSGDRAW